MTYVTQTLQAVSDLGARSLRWQILWQVMEPSEGKLDWSIPDRIVQAAEAIYDSTADADR